MLRLPPLNVLPRKDIGMFVSGRGRWTIVEVEETSTWQIGGIFDE
jgi:hypothetical protein